MSLLHRSLVTGFGLAIIIVISCTKTRYAEGPEPFRQALALADQSQWARADSLMQKLTGVDSTKAWGYYGRGVLFERRLMLLDALNQYSLALDTDSRFDRAADRGERLYGWLGEDHEAAQFTRSLARIRASDPVSEARLARRLMTILDFDAANAAIAKAESLGLDSLLTGLLRARLNLLSLRTENADLATRTLLAVDRDDSLFLVLAADFLEDRGYADSSLAYSRRLLSRAGATDADSLDHFFRALRVGGYFDAWQMATARLRGADSIRALGMLVQHALAARLTRPAELYGLRYFVATTSGYSPKWYDYHIQDLLGRYPQAKDALSELMAVQVRPGTSPEFRDAILHFIRMNTARYSGKAELAQDLDTISGWRSALPQTVVTRAFAKAWSGPLDQIEYLKDTLVLNYGSDPIRMKLAGDVCQYRDIRRLDWAREFYLRALLMAPRYYPAFDALVRMEMGQGDFAGALATIEGNSYFTDVFPAVRVQKAVCLGVIGRTADAVRLMDENAPYCRQNLAPLGRLAQSLARRNDGGNTRAIIKLATGLNPDYAHAWGLAAQWYSRIGDHNEAIDAADRAVRLDPDFLDPVAFKAWSLAATDKLDDAVTLLEQALKKDNANSELGLVYSRILADAKREPAQAQNLARMAVFSDQQSSRAILNLCYVYMATNRPDLAIGEARNGLATYPTVPEFDYYLGYAMSRTNDTASATHLRAALAKGLSGDMAESARTLLGQP